MKWLCRTLDCWLDDRTGYRRLLHEALHENIPGGSRWSYIFGSMLVFAFVTQTITGLFLWMSYSPGSQNAWESVYYIQNELQGGWFLRGLHHFMAQAMVVLLPLHLIQVVVFRAYVAPREINYWLGLVLMLITLGLGLTGYLLPWDQKGYWATKVATELSSLPPGGGYIQKLIVGGPEYGHLTLTRFFALHTGVLPALLVGVLVMHMAMFRRHGVTPGRLKRPDEPFFPVQVLKDAVGCLVMLAIVCAIVVWRQGAELGPPAEPTADYGAARPEWYFLFLFQLLKHAPSEFIGAIVIPAAVVAFLFVMPFIARLPTAHYLNLLVILLLVAGAGYLTYEAIDRDNYHVWHQRPPRTDLEADYAAAAQKFHAERDQAHHEYERTRELVAFHGIPPSGAAGLARTDPEIQGPRLFKSNCASCHSYAGSEPPLLFGPSAPKNWDGQTPYAAPNLYGFASREWILGLLDPDQIVNGHYFGGCRHGLPESIEDDQKVYPSGGMVEFVRDNLRAGDPDLATLAVGLSAEAKLPTQQAADATASQDGTLERGRTLVVEKSCTECHKFHDEGDLGAAPDLTGYGSYQWLYDFIANAGHERFYSEGNDRMPAFAEHRDDPSRNALSAQDIDLLVRWLRGDARRLAVAAGNAPPAATEPSPPAGAANQTAADAAN